MEERPGSVPASRVGFKDEEPNWHAWKTTSHTSGCCMMSAMGGDSHRRLLAGFSTMKYAPRSTQARQTSLENSARDTPKASFADADATSRTFRRAMLQVEHGVQRHAPYRTGADPPDHQGPNRRGSEVELGAVVYLHAWPTARPSPRHSQGKPRFPSKELQKETVLLEHPPTSLASEGRWHVARKHPRGQQRESGGRLKDSRWIWMHNSNMRRLLGFHRRGCRRTCMCRLWWGLRERGNPRGQRRAPLFQASMGFEHP